ncbi:MAG: glycosyltransferase [Cyanobacteria bacterium J06555_13]
MLNPDVNIIADCHNATFRNPWIALPGMVTLLNGCSLVLVHSEQVEQQAKDLGINQDLVCLLEDPPSVIEPASGAIAPQEPIPYRHPWALCPCSFNRDEPIGELIAAAALAPEITFVITGKPSRAKGIHDLSNLPKNVVLSGFLPLDRFDELLLSADVVLGLTKLDGIQLSAAVEAIGAGTPMVLSNTTLLKKLFYKGAIYVDSNAPESISQGVQQAISGHSTLTQAVVELREERQLAWLGQTSPVNLLLG